MKDSFIVQLAVKLWLTAMGAPPIVSAIVGPILSWVLGSFADLGILKIDLTIDALKRGMSLAEFNKIAGIEYKKAAAKVYTEGEKDEIRRQYLDTLERFAGFGNGLR